MRQINRELVHAFDFRLSTFDGFFDTYTYISYFETMRRFLVPAIVVQVVMVTAQSPASARRQERTLQEAAEQLLAESRVPYGAIVVVRVPDAKVLALAGHSRAEPELGPDELALAP